MERLTFNPGSSGRRSMFVAGRLGRRGPDPAPAAAPQAPRRAERYDWDYLWMLAFTALLFFRPQDQIPGLAALHLPELTALAGLAAMAVRRMAAGQPIAHIDAEVIGTIALGGVIIFTIPFSTWPGGSLNVFSDIYIKIILIFALMISTLSSPKRLHQLTWMMILASGYLAGRAVFDYARGVNLVEGNRVRGAVGGIFENPNDLALNLVTFLAPTLVVMLHDRKPLRRAVAAVLAPIIVAAIVFTKSRSGFLGLIAMCLVVAFYTIRVRPGVVLASLLALLVAMPLMPQSFWSRMDSILNAQEDPTGSREARIHLMQQGLQVFADNPITGVGAGQFKNYYDPDQTIERWHVTHDVWLQVAAELGIFGLVAFAFLVARGFMACTATLRLIRPPRRRAGAATPPGRARAPDGPAYTTLGEDDRYTLEMNARAMRAGLTGWFVCALFASVAFNWTFYYVLALAVAGREIAAAGRLPAPQGQPAPVLPFARVHA